MMEDIVAMARAAQRDDRLADGALYGKLADEVESLRAKLLPFIRADWYYMGSGKFEGKVTKEALDAAKADTVHPRLEKTGADAPCHYGPQEADAWANGYNAAPQT